MNYRESIDFLLSFADFERSGRFLDRPDLEPLLSLLHRLGDPHLALPAGRQGRRTVHIAGSKGKGSVAAMLESVLRGRTAAGLRTGLFTSPHLHEYTERVRIDGEPLDEGAWARLTGVIREAVAATETAGRRLVTFDLLTALAFLAFRECAVDVQVLEVGLGGRLDSTNVFETKDVCAITAIGLEHTDILGDTVEAIAAEKAGIIRPGAAVVIGPQEHAEARTVVRRAAEAAGCPVVDVAADYSWRLLANDLEGQTFQLSGPRGDLDLRLPLLGAHQLENAATAVACADALSARGVALPDEAVERGLATVVWPGRLEVLRRRPLVIADGAHSADSARRLRRSLTDYFSAADAFLIVGMSAGKDAEALARELAPVAGRVTAVHAGHPRAMPPGEVAAAFRKAGVRAEAGGTVAEALDGALAVAQDDDVICLAGSLFVVAEGRARLQRTKAKA
jgi:dihydrofolate synthase/folylpolyglutamate synthase